ncbi:MAG: hypothetical protein L6R39_006396 [Caloplaca ligustica]|nr:MAG: hypothetical protein L6R39_006396 [Caloplaca ligustica]
MTEYEKLTVAKLRDELTRRGLPKAGLKRLVEADEQSTQLDPTINDDKARPPEGDDLEEGRAPASAESQQQHKIVIAIPAQDDAETTALPLPDAPQNVAVRVDHSTNGKSLDNAVDAQNDGSLDGGSSIPLRTDATDQSPEEEQPQKDALRSTPNGRGEEAELRKDSSASVLAAEEEPSTDRAGRLPGWRRGP